MRAVAGPQKPRGRERGDVRLRRRRAASGQPQRRQRLRAARMRWLTRRRAETEPRLHLCLGPPCESFVRVGAADCQVCLGPARRPAAVVVESPAVRREEHLRRGHAVAQPMRARRASGPPRLARTDLTPSVSAAPARLVVGIPAADAEIQLRFEVPPALVLQGAPPLDRAARAAAVGALQKHHDMALQVIREGGYVASIRRVHRGLRHRVRTGLLSMLIKRRFAVGSEVLTLVYRLNTPALSRRLYLAACKDTSFLC